MPIILKLKEKGAVIMQFEIIDFHTHPFMDERTNICMHKEYCNMNIEGTKKVYEKLGVSKICGSVIETGVKEVKWEHISYCNNKALELKEIYGEFYIPGFHIHPKFPEESYTEMERMDKKGIKLIGELVPYHHVWSDYSCPEFSELLKEAGKRNMIVNIHTNGNDEMDEMVKRHKDVMFVAAHPGEYNDLMRHFERMKMSENYYLDISGTGLFRYGMLKRAVDCFGAERILFGSDYPVCNPGMFVGGVLFDSLLTESQKEKIFSLNAKNLLGI